MKNILVGGILILAAAFARLIPHPANVTPLAAMALAGGVYLDRRFALLIPVAALFLSDLVLGFHPTMLFVYGSFLATGLIGYRLRKHRSMGFITAGAVASSVLFFLVTNFGVWLTGGGWHYAPTWNGLVTCYIAALPFFRNSLIGDLFSTGLLFGLFTLSERWLIGEATAVRAERS